MGESESSVHQFDLEQLDQLFCCLTHDKIKNDDSDATKLDNDVH